MRCAQLSPNTVTFDQDPTCQPIDVCLWPVRSSRRPAQSKGRNNILDNEPAAPGSIGLDWELPAVMNTAVFAVSSALSDGAERLMSDWDHCHVSVSSMQRTSEDGALIEYQVSRQLVLCSKWTCGAPDDGGVASWQRWAPGKNIDILDGADLRSDEELAVAAIRQVLPSAHIERLEEDGSHRKADLLVESPDEGVAEAEVTMHTDHSRRQISK